MSDLHDNVAAWNILVQELVAREISILINCGDTAAPAMLQVMSRTFPGTIHTVFGNVADEQLETEVAKSLTNVIHHGERGAIDVHGRRVGFTHRPEIAEAMAKSGEFDLVCHGHTHLKRWQKIGDCLVLNPGTAGGMFQYPSFALIDLAIMAHEFVELKL